MVEQGNERESRNWSDKEMRRWREERKRKEEKKMGTS